MIHLHLGMMSPNCNSSSWSSKLANCSKRDHSLSMHAKFMPTLTDYKPPNSTLNVLHHNAHSFLPKLPIYTALPHIQNFDIFSVSESWLKPNLPSGIIDLPNFNVFRCDRNNSSKSLGGGAMLLVKTNLKATRLLHLQPTLSTCDSVWVKLHMLNSADLIVGSIYLPPDHDKSLFVHELVEVLSDPCFDKTKVLICGDFNINWSKPSQAKEQLSNAASQFELAQVASGMSYVSHQSANESLIDLCFVSKCVSVNKCSMLVNDISDHYALSISVTLKPNRQPRKLIKSRNYRAGLPALSMHNHHDDILIQSLHANSDSPHVQAILFESWVYQLVERCVPVKQYRIRPDSPKWLDTDLKRLVSVKNRFFRRVRLDDRDSAAWMQYKKFRKYVQKELTVAKRKYYTSRLGSGIPSFFKEIKVLLRHSSGAEGDISLSTDSGDVINKPADVAVELNKFFTNLESPKPGDTDLPCTTGSTFQLAHVTALDVSNVMRKLDSNKRGGVHSFPTSVYQCLYETTIPAITCIFNSIVDTSIFPDIYKKALVTPLFKRGDKTQASN